MIAATLCASASTHQCVPTCGSMRWSSPSVLLGLPVSVGAAGTLWLLAAWSRCNPCYMPYTANQMNSDGSCRELHVRCCTYGTGTLVALQGANDECRSSADREHTPELHKMEPYAEGQALASAAVAMATYFAFAIWSAANLKRTKCKLYEVLLVSAVGKPMASPSSMACLQSRPKDLQGCGGQELLIGQLAQSQLASSMQ